VLIFFNDIKNGKKLNELKELIKESNCHINIDEIQNNKTIQQALRKILTKCN